MLFTNLARKFPLNKQTQHFSTSLLLKGARELWRLDTKNPFLEIPEAWVTSLDEIEDRRREIIQLHPGLNLQRIYKFNLFF